MGTEFEKAAWLRQALGEPRSHALVVPNGDDAAVMRVDGQLVVTTDALVEGVDWGPWAPWECVGRKALAANLSDLAAMGAQPLGYVLALCLPRAFPEAALEALCQGLSSVARAYGAPCVGGDLSGTSGPVTVCITALGTVPPGQALERSGARPGDRLFVSGWLGGAAAGLALLMGQGASAGSLDGVLGRWTEEPLRQAVTAQLCPQPRLGVGTALRGVAHACMDISDGFIQDLGHMLVASGVGAVLEGPLPQHPGVAAAARALGRDGGTWVLSGGEEFELLFTVPPDREKAVDHVAQSCGVPLHAVGRITAERTLVLPDGRLLTREDVEDLDAGRAPRAASLQGLAGFAHFG